MTDQPTPAFTAELAKMTMQFLQRAQMAGAEVPAFMQVMQALNAIAQPTPAQLAPVAPPASPVAE